MIFSIDTKLQDLLNSEAAAKILQKHLAPICAMAQKSPQALQLSPAQLAGYAGIPGMKDALPGLEQELSKLNGTADAITPKEREQMERFAQMEQLRVGAGPKPVCHHQDSIQPGKVWLDICGEKIQAHGGAVFYENGIYYWYGENKEFTDGQNGIWTWGIRAYTSNDLCNWADLGLIIPPVLDDPNSSMFPTKRVDRPHILRCPSTGKYVCWIKISGPEAAFTIWQADALTGPYKMVENLYRPAGCKVGDFDLITDEETGKGYLYFDADHRAMVCMELDTDYLHAKQEVTQSYRDLKPPFTREAPCLFTANGYRYMITSGMTGYVPNRSDCAMATAWNEPFHSIGDPHRDDCSCASFNSQISKVFPVQGKPGKFIAMADRWLPNYPVDARIADLFTRVVANSYDPIHYPATEQERQEMYAANKIEQANTSLAEYVWLPLTVTEPDEQHPEGTISIFWQDEWRPKDL